MEDNLEMNFIDADRFQKSNPITYNRGWIVRENETKCGVLCEDSLLEVHDESSWSSQIEAMHEEPTKNGWIDVYERKCVKSILKSLLLDGSGGTIAEFGASVGYMIDELKSVCPKNSYIAADLMSEGLLKHYGQDQEIMHIQCDLTNAPFKDESMDMVYALNVLEHITDDARAVRECFRILKRGGYCLFVVPRGEKLYDYFDEMLFHKRRYAKGELKRKAEEAGFTIVKDWHFAWLCYPAFYLKKRFNQMVGRRLTQEEKMKRVESDIKTAFASPLAKLTVRLEELMSRGYRPAFGIREMILLRKDGP